MPAHIGTQNLLFQFWFLHQPVSELAQEIKVRTAAFKSARPEPHLIGEQKRHPAFALARENQQRLSGGTRQNTGTVGDFGIDLAKPFAPRWRILIGTR